MPYPWRPGVEAERLQLIWEIYNWTGSQTSGKRTHIYPQQPTNKNRETTIAWDLCQIFAAIAGGYVIELSPHYKGVQLVRKNKELWKRVSAYVKLKTGQGCLPYDIDGLGEQWEKMNDVSFFSVH
jgi:hypothetical protein